MLLSADGESSHFRSSETSLLGQRRKLQINRKVTPIHTIGGCCLSGQPFGNFVIYRMMLSLARKRRCILPFLCLCRPIFFIFCKSDDSARWCVYLLLMQRLMGKSTRQNKSKLFSWLYPKYDPESYSGSDPTSTHFPKCKKGMTHHPGIAVLSQDFLPYAFVVFLAVSKT